MTLVEVGPIMKTVARRHHVAVKALRNDVSLREPRVDAMVELRRAGLMYREVAKVLGCTWEAVKHATPAVGRTDGIAASPCPGCDRLQPLAAFWKDARTADGCATRCKEHTIERKRSNRLVGATEKRYRRARGRKRRQLQAYVEVGLVALLEDTAARHRVTKVEIVERALAKALACKDCGNRLRDIGSDCCRACDEPWMTEVAS